MISKWGEWMGDDVIPQRKPFKVKRVNSKKMLARLLIKQEDRCFFCNIKIHQSYKKLLPLATIDHLTPLSRGGKHKETNCVAACFSCNNEKGARTLEQYLEYKKGLTDDTRRIEE